MTAESPTCIPSQGWDFTQDDFDSSLLDAAPFTSFEKTLSAFIVIFSIVGVLANLLEIVTLVYHRSKWDNYAAYLPGGYLTLLAVSDACYLLLVLIYILAPWSNSPLVSYDYGFQNCWALIFIMLVAQVFSAGITAVIAVETFKPPFPVSKNTTIILIGLAAILCTVACTVSTGVFTSDTTECVAWPQTAEYAGHPSIIHTCPWRQFPTFRFVLFHDIPVFYIAGSVVTYYYWKVIQKIKSGDGGADTAETVNNLRVRIIVYIGFQLMARVLNIAGSYYMDAKGSVLFPEYTAGSEVAVLILRGLLWLQLAINPFIYFLAKPAYRTLVLKMFRRERDV